MYNLSKIEVVTQMDLFDPSSPTKTLYNKADKDFRLVLGKSSSYNLTSNPIFLLIIDIYNWWKSVQGKSLIWFPCYIKFFPRQLFLNQEC